MPSRASYDMDALDYINLCLNSPTLKYVKDFHQQVGPSKIKFRRDIGVFLMPSVTHKMFMTVT